MISSRFAIALLIIFQLTVIACGGFLLSMQVTQQLQDDQQALLSQLTNSPSTDKATLTPLFNRLPVQFARIGSVGEQTPWNYRSYQAPTHPLAALLDAAQLQQQTKVQQQSVTVGFDGDYYLNRFGKPMLPILLGTSLINLLLAVLVIIQGRRQQRNLTTLELAGLQLSSLDLPGGLQTITGPFSALAANLISTRDKLKLQVQQLQRTNATQALEAMNDPLTQLPNRTQFNTEMEELLSKPGNIGQLLMVRASVLEEINSRQGKLAGDSYLINIAKALKGLSDGQHQVHLYRYGGSDFIAALPNRSMADVNAIMEQLSKQLTDIAQRVEFDSAGYIGAVSYSHHDRISQLLMQLDTAISIAQSEGPNRHYQLAPESAEFELETDRWAQVIDDVISNTRIEFTYQSVISLTENTPFYRELLARFTNKDGNPLPTQILFAMANRHDRAIELDKLLFTQAVREIIHHGEADQSYGFNISSHSVNDPEFLGWLEERITRTPELSGRLVLEINEHAINIKPQMLNQWIARIHQHGVRIAVERFGNSLSSFKSLQLLRPDYVKLDPCFSKDIDNDANNRFFVKMLLDIAVRLEIRVIATHIEQYEERITMEALRVDGVQGHLVASPQPMNAKPLPADLR
ncbi:EAL domain-containing protein [Ferrimonas senticii]|uniref:EAL domain-containing protein n=1 Tax=Ferrimonas senticii TaxID=394566 RepID=UPI000414192E|nr:EAL domain-containing protein [Ferrimonas senticii]